MILIQIIQKIIAKTCIDGTGLSVPCATKLVTQRTAVQYNRYHQRGFEHKPAKLIQTQGKKLTASKEIVTTAAVRATESKTASKKNRTPTAVHPDL